MTVSQHEQHGTERVQHEVPAGLETDCKTGLASSSGGIFKGYFASERKWNFKKDDLLDARGRRLFESTAMACAADAYPFQVPLEGKTGPIISTEGRQMLMLSSYDYLGLIGDPRIDEAAIEAVKKYGTGTGGARLLTGTLDLHHEMERDLAGLKGTEAALAFSSGYMANLGVITSLFGPADRVVLDALCHRSLLDACKMAGVQVQKYRHNDMDSLREELRGGAPANRTLIIVDGVFSMDGDICPLPELIAIKKEFGCFLLVDEAHSIGVIGGTGRGTDEYFGIGPEGIDIWTGSLAKSIPSTGGFVLMSKELAIYMQHAASPFIFSAAVSAPAAAVIRKGIEILKSEPERVARLQENAVFLREGLNSLGFDTGLSETAVIPVVMGEDIQAALFARKLRDHSILACPVIFPAVAQGSARLRLCVTAAHTKAHLEYVLDTFQKLSKS
ncbi:aminotransferase class I/II-fold pyridoxal phosphate-dependent enzyme [Granulicella sp. WH15]|uniref:aminotransferase class I/II-fold pyridoxal phosphate-dependent enzyme n=1 Tax=Granulicella sp. WH15 TaxID=2602070 RepID=UPI001366969A|nr:aminotransferase class I/II-fold pyridoxal phosphate-dependent enzyme [Granulicella sp. WH15]QHN04133.1 aminotransferase class I/II-fold pyridoxal phosphate-dependent enzyme [Granulicella sp. WH15]